jgi:hypothetical protein
LQQNLAGLEVVAITAIVVTSIAVNADFVQILQQNLERQG